MKSLLEESATTRSTSLQPPEPKAPDLPSILMVDDAPARLLTYEAVLSGMPLHCVRAHSGEEALAMLLKHSFALILLDVNMPGMDGFEVARHVRSLARLGKMPIVFITGERFTDLDRLKGYEVGAIDYINVPIVPEILRSKVALLIELYHRRTELDRLATAATRAIVPGVDTGASATQLRALFDQSPDIQFILRGERDAGGNLSVWRYVDANTSALRFYGRTREEVVGRTVHETFPERAARAELLCQRALLGGERLQYETEYNGRQLYVRVFAVDDGCVALTCTDITERKRTEHALANSERRFQALLERCPVGVAQNDMDGRFIYVNVGFCDIVGYTAEELSQLTWQQITHPDDLAADLAMGREVLSGTRPHYNMEKRYLRKDGTPVWVSMFGNFIFDEQRLPVQGVAVVVDISARKLADDAVRESRERLQLAHEAAGLGSFDWDVATNVLTWDTRARELWGFAPDTAIDLDAGMAGIHPDDREMVRHQIEASLDPRTRRDYMATYRVINIEDGETRWIEAHGQVKFENHRPVRMVGTVRDISARVMAEQSLRASEERFRELANNIDQIVWTADANGEPTWYNDRWREITGAPLEKMVDEGWATLVHPDHADRITQGFRHAVAAGETWEDTFPVLAKDGQYRWFLVRAIPIKGADGTVLRWFGTNTDVSAQRRLQDALTDADRRKDEFLAMLAHELRNPVAPIVNVAQVLARKIADEQAADLVAVVQRQAAHLARLLDDLLDVARITRGRIELRREVLDINECIAVAIETAEPWIYASNHRLEIARSPEVLFVDADRVRLTQCITNLLNNSAKYSESGTRIRVRTYAADGNAFIEVHDQGRGIAPDMLPRIFDLFAQDQRTLDRNAGGLGIGLSVCKKLIEMHGGSVSALSAGIGQGSTFTLRLPLAAPPLETVEVEEAAPAVTRRRVFIVDDNTDAADSIAMLLQLSGHETQVAYDGEQAVASYGAFAPDVVLLDIGLPGMDGYQLMQKLRADGYRGHAIALSGYGQPEDTQKALSSGFDAHLVKPVELDRLERALAQAG